jgi:opacity protein-like surface antigen
MKLTILALTATSLFAFATPAVSAEGWYLGLGAGWSQLEDGGYSVQAFPVTGDASFDSTIKGSLTGGYKWLAGFRAEIELAYAKYDVRAATANGAPNAGAGGDLSIGTLMGNVSYDVAIGPSFSLTAGGGIGAASVTAGYSDPIASNHGSDSSFAWQLIAGVIWSVSPRFDLQVDYRYVRIGETTHDLVFQGTPVGPVDYADSTAHNVMLTARWFP